MTMGGVPCDTPDDGLGPTRPQNNRPGTPQHNNDKGNNGPGPHGPTDNWEDPTAYTMIGQVTP